MIILHLLNSDDKNQYYLTHLLTYVTLDYSLLRSAHPFVLHSLSKKPETSRYCVLAPFD